MADQPNNNGQNEASEFIDIPVYWDTTREIPTVYANQFIITHGGKEFYLIFGEANVPLLTGAPGEPLPESISIRPMVKIAIAHEVMLEIANAINQNVAKFLSRIQAENAMKDEE